MAWLLSGFTYRLHVYSFLENQVEWLGSHNLRRVDQKEEQQWKRHRYDSPSLKTLYSSPRSLFPIPTANQGVHNSSGNIVIVIVLALALAIAIVWLTAIKKTFSLRAPKQLARPSSDPGLPCLSKPNLNLYTLPVAEKTYHFRVPYYGFYIWFLKKVGLFGYR